MLSEISQTQKNYQVVSNLLGKRRLSGEGVGTGECNGVNICDQIYMHENVIMKPIIFAQLIYSNKKT
jgi:hypothetical protein